MKHLTLAALILLLSACQSSPDITINGDSNAVTIEIEGDPSRGGQTTSTNADVGAL